MNPEDKSIPDALLAANDLTREDIEIILATYTPETQTFIAADEERVRAEREAFERHLAQEKLREEARAKEKERVGALLAAKGIRLNIDGCGCCGSPSVSIEIDGELVVDDEYDYNIKMITP